MLKQDLFFTWEKACQYPVYYQLIENHFCIYIYQMYDLYTYVYIELEERERGASTNLQFAIPQIFSLESWPGVNNQMSGDNCTVISSSRLWL